MSEKFDRSHLRAFQETAERYHENLTAEHQTYLNDRGIEDALVEKYLLGTSDGINAGAISIPYLRPPHGVVWFNYRTGGSPKYKAPGDKHLYNTVPALALADETGEVFITEGEFDAIIATEHYGLPAIAVPGATQWTGNAKFRELFVGYQRVFVLADPDEAGLQLASAILERLPAARLIGLPFDVTDCFKNDVDIEELVRG